MSKFYSLGFNDFGLIACSSVDGQPCTYETEAEVLAEIADFRETLADAGMDCDLDWQAIPVSEYSIAELQKECGLI